jgi:hypothetical protein
MTTMKPNDEFDPEAAMFYADLARVSRVTAGLRYKARSSGVYGQFRDNATGEVVYETLVYPRGYEKEALVRCDIYAEQQGWTVAK